MRAHLPNKRRIGQTEMCPCDTAPMDIDRLLQDCPLQDIPREKLYGDLATLKKTASFVRATGVDI